MENNTNTKNYSIKHHKGHVQIVDHVNNKIVEPLCGQDALAYHQYMLGNLRFGITPEVRQHQAARFLGDIAKGKKPITDMINKNRPSIR